MSEFEENSAERAAESERVRALDSVINEYFETEKEFLAGYEFGVRLGAVYGMLLELGEDPETILRDAGVITEGNDSEI